MNQAQQDILARAIAAQRQAGQAHTAQLLERLRQDLEAAAADDRKERIEAECKQLWREVYAQQPTSVTRETLLMIAGCAVEDYLERWYPGYVAAGKEVSA